MDVRTALVACLAATAIGCATAPPQGIDRNLLEGAWTSSNESFEFVIRRDTILFEFDMKEHPYRLEGDILVIDFEDPTLGVQRKQILRLTEEELELSDVLWDGSTVYRHVEQRGRSR